jgi:hypothetical protein
LRMIQFGGLVGNSVLLERLDRPLSGIPVAND